MAWPMASLVAPLVALGFGLAFGALHFSVEATYTAALIPLALLIVLTMPGAALGAWAVLGHALGDLVFATHLRAVANGPLDMLIEVWLPLSISYVVLATLTVGIPLTCRSLGRSSLQRIGIPGTRTLPAMVVAAALAFLWAQGAPVLIRPLHLWTYYQPRIPAEVIQPLQNGGWMLALAAAVGAALRIRLEQLSSHRQSSSAVRAVRSAPSRRGGWLPGWLTVPLGAAFTTLCLAGMLENWLDAIVCAVGLTLVCLLRAILPRYAVYWVTAITRVPLVIRVVVGIAVSLYAALQLVGGSSSVDNLGFRLQPLPPDALVVAGEGLRPLLLPLLLSQVVFALLLPARGVPTRSGARATAPLAATSSAVVGLALALAMLGSLVRPELAFADNCSSLGDCWAYIGLAALALAAIAGGVAILGPAIAAVAAEAEVGAAAVGAAEAATGAAEAATAAAEAATTSGSLNHAPYSPLRWVGLGTPLTMSMVREYAFERRALQ